MEGLGIASPTTKRATETISEEPWLARIPWDTRETVGVPGLAGAELAAAARVGCVRVRCCGALEGLRLGANDAREGTENGGELGCELWQLWP